ncbi:MAG TPA: cupin domain-containing protein [bacterium]
MAGPGRRGNLFDDATAPGGRERFDELLARDGARVERIVSTGQTTPPGEWFDQAGEEWVALLTGRATLLFEGGERVELAAGDWVAIPARARHRVEATSADPPCVWLAVHLPPSS